MVQPVPPARPRLTTIGPSSTVLQAIHVYPGATGQVLACKEHIRLAQYPVQHLHSHAWKVRATSCCILQEPWLPLTLVDLPLSLVMNTARDMKYAPVVKLGPEFKLLQQYLRRVPHIPNLVDLEHLTVSGDVHFGRDVVLKVSSRVGGCCCLLSP